MNDKMTWLVEYLRRNGAMSAEEVIQEAADAMKAQAERIKVLELDLDVQAGSIEAVQAVNARQAERIKALEGQLDDATAAARSDQMIAETAQAAASRLITERDNLRAQLNAIAATEPVAYRWVWKSKPHDIEGWCYTSTPPNSPELQEIEKLFTRPMPAEIENVEPVIWAISYDGVTPYTLWHEGDGPLLDCEVKRQGGTTQKMPLFTAAPAPQTEEPVATDNMNHPLRTWKDPLSAWWHCRSNWGIGGIGLSEAEAITNWADENPKEVTRLGLFTRTMPVQPIIGLQAVHDAITVDPTLADCSQDMNAELVEALEELARLGNGDQYGNSDGNMIARTALSKYKGAK